MGAHYSDTPRGCVDNFRVRYVAACLPVDHLCCCRHCRPQSVVPSACRKRARVEAFFVEGESQKAPVVVLVGGLEGTWRIFARRGARSRKIRSDRAESPRFQTDRDSSAQSRRESPSVSSRGRRLSRERRIARALEMDRQSSARSRGRCRRRLRTRSGAVAEPGRRFRQDSRRRAWTPRRAC